MTKQMNAYKYNYKVLSLSPSLFKMSVTYSATNDPSIAIIISVIITLTTLTKSLFLTDFILQVIF